MSQFNGFLSRKKLAPIWKSMNGHQKMDTPQEVVNSLLALDLPPTPSPEAQSNVSAESSQTGVSTRSVHILSKSKVQKEE